MTRAAAATLIDGLQFCRWSRPIFEQMNAAGLTAVHATVAYHETFRKTVEHLVDWNWRFRENADLILMGRTAADIDRARESGRTAIFFGLQNPLAAELAGLIGADHLGIGSDLCQDQPDGVVRWMREGRWMRPDPAPVGFPEQPARFRDNRDFPKLATGLVRAGGHRYVLSVTGASRKLAGRREVFGPPTDDAATAETRLRALQFDGQSEGTGAHPTRSVERAAARREPTRSSHARRKRPVRGMSSRVTSRRSARSARSYRSGPCPS